MIFQFKLINSRTKGFT